MSNDGKNWGAPAAKGSFKNTGDRQVIRLAAPATCRYLKLVALSGMDGQIMASIAELDVQIVESK